MPIAFAALPSARQILGFTILATPVALMCWAWTRLIFRRVSDPPFSAWRLPLLFLVLMTVSYGLTLATIFNHTVGNYFAHWNGHDVGIYLLIAFLACPFSWFSVGPIRRQVLSLGLILCAFYFWVIWSSME